MAVAAASWPRKFYAHMWQKSARRRDVGAAWGSTASFINNFKLLSKMVLALSLSLCRQIVLYALGLLCSLLT